MLFASINRKIQRRVRRNQSRIAILKARLDAHEDNVKAVVEHSLAKNDLAIARVASGVIRESKWAAWDEAEREFLRTLFKSQKVDGANNVKMPSNPYKEGID